MTSENDAVVRDLQTSVMRLTEMLDRMAEERSHYRDVAGALYSACLAYMSGSPDAHEMWSKAEQAYRQDYV